MAQDRFVDFLNEELERKKRLNHRYSLRSYAKLLGIYHGTLSSILSGKRRLTEKTKIQLAKKIDPDNLQGFVIIPEAKKVAHIVLDEQTFNEISQWHYDAIMELVKLKTTPWSINRAAKYLDLSEEVIKTSISRLIEIGLIKETAKGLVVLGEYATTTTTTTTALAISKKDVPKVKELIRNFSCELSSLLQKDNPEFDEVSGWMRIWWSQNEIFFKSGKI